MSSSENNNNNIKTAKEIYDEKTLASLIGNDFPADLQDTCINSIKYKMRFYGPPENGHTAWTGLECVSGEAKGKLAYCESCILYKYMRNANDVV